MRFAITIAAVPLLLLSAMAAPFAHAQDHHQHHAPPAAAAAQEAPAQRYETDAPLRKGMGQIRTAVDAMGHYEHGHMGPEQAVALATQVQQQVAYLIANCKLAPQADAALHVIIAKLSTGAQAIKSSPTDLSAIPPMRDALQSYAHQFNDPGRGGGSGPQEAH